MQFHEYPNISQLKKQLENIAIYAQDRSRLANYYKQLKDDEYVEVAYAKKSFAGKEYGRFFPVDGSCLPATYQWRKLRSSLFGKDHYDIDIVNCHPVLLKQLYKKITGGDCPFLTFYIENRSDIIDEIVIDEAAIERYNKENSDDRTKRDYVKRLFTTLIYGGGLTTWKKSFNLKDGEFDLQDYYEPFHEEVTRIREAVVNSDYGWIKQLREDVYKERGADYDNKKLMSLILQELECQIVVSAMRHFDIICKGKYEICAYMYDGFMVRDDHRVASERINNKILNICKQVARAVKEELGYEITLITKPFETPLLATTLCLPAIFDPECELCYDSYKTISFNEIDKYISSVFALIENGGSSYWVVKNFRDNEVYFQSIKKGSLCEKNFKDIYWTDQKQKITLYSRLLQLSTSISYSYEDFKPYLYYSPQCFFNLFSGFRHKVASFEPALFEPVRNHIEEVWANGDKEIYEYTINWLSHIIQFPDKRTDTAFIMKSQQGAGKNIIIDFLFKHVVGERYTLHVDKIMDLFKRFNSKLAHKLLTCVDETYTSEMQRGEISEHLKSLITRTKVSIEKKGMDEITIGDYNNYIFFTNRNDPLPIEADDRRFFAVECSNKYCGNSDYFKNLASSMTSEAGAAMFSWLATRDISQFDPRQRPVTAFKNEMKLNNQPIPIVMIIEILNGERDVSEISEDGVNINITSKRLYDTYQRYAAEKGVRPLTERQVSNCLARIEPMKQKRQPDGTKPRGWYDLTVEDLKNQLCNYLKINNLDE